MSSQDLQIGGGSTNPGFVQQGQVDWVAFANTTISGSIAVMQRLSAAGVQPTTVAGGLALASRFTLGKRGQQNMDVALKNLSGVFGYNKILYYGFGYRSFVNILTEKKIGINLVALCACLVDMHGVPVAAEVLAALWTLEGFPEEFEPSISQFNALVTACAGVVAATTFGQTGDIMLGDLRKLRPGKSSITGLPAGSISNANDIAKVLHGLFQISRGTIEHINVVGGANCAFIGAVAHWLLDFAVYVEDERGAPIFQSALHPESAQVKIQYRHSDQVSTELQIASTTYILGDHRDMLIHTPWEDEFFLNIRTPWDGCLERIFGNSFRRLKSLPLIFGEFLGSAARIYAGLAEGEADVGNFSRRCFTEFIDSTYGYGFINSTGLIFPELGRIKDLDEAMQKASGTSFRRAMSCGQLAIESLTRLCECIECAKSSDRYTKKLDELEETTCLLAAVITITHLVRLVAGLERNFMLNPSISGMQLLYGRFCRNIVNRPIAIHSALGLQESQSTPSITPAHLMADVECLFTGHLPTPDEISRNNYRTAFSYSGICCFLEALRRPSSNAVDLRHIHVSPGHIQRGDREYNSVWDSAPTPRAQLPKAKLEIESIKPPSDMRDDKIDIKALVTEVSGGGQLIFYYQATVQETTVLIRPGMLTQRVLERTGLITCDKRTCGIELLFPCRVVCEGWEIDNDTRTTDSQTTNCIIWPFRETDAGRYVAIETVPFKDFYIRRGECLPCCTKAVSNLRSSTII